MAGDQIKTGNIEGIGIAVGTGASVQIYGDIYYYPIKLKEALRTVFAKLIEDRTRLFAGREEIFGRIGQFIQASHGGYLIITAPAGFGKTALIAALVSRTPEAFAYHFFNSLDTLTLNEEFFLRNTVQQMAQWHGHTEQLPDRLDELRPLYDKFIAEPLERTRVLVLSGLDEVAWDLKPYLDVGSQTICTSS